MGMASVDLAVLWSKQYCQFDVCYKPTSRLAQFASLGIPVVAYPFASYIDIFVRCSPLSAWQSQHISVGASASLEERIALISDGSLQLQPWVESRSCMRKVCQLLPIIVHSPRAEGTACTAVHAS